MSLPHLSKILLATIGIFTLISCSALEDMDGMKKTTHDMRDITDRLSKKTNEVSETAAILLRDARQGGSIEARARAMNSINHVDTCIEDKILHAATYFQSFEFQLWENFLTDDELRRQRLLALGAEEFMLTFRGIIGGKHEAPNPLSTDSSMQSLLALALAVDQVNLLQIEASERSGFTALSMFDLIVSSLRMLPNVNETYKLPPYAERILLYEDDVRYLFELRHNVFAAMTLDKLYNVAQLGLLEKLMLFLKSNVNIDFTKLNAVELTEITNVYLKKSIEAHTLMKEFGTSIKLNKNVLKILKKANFIDDKQAGAAKREAIDKFKSAYSELILL